MFKKLSQEFNYRFSVNKDGLYSINIQATCQSGKFLGLFGGEDLRVEIGGRSFREIPAKDKVQYFDIPPAWNGTRLKGLSKTVVFILYLNKGEHTIKFMSKRGAQIEKEPTVKLFNQQDKILENIQAQDGNRRHWITIALIDLPLNILDISAICEKRFMDSDDLKLIIDNKIQNNQQSKIWAKNWYWQGSQLKGDAQTARFTPQLPAGIHYIEFWADRMPLLNEVKVKLGEFVLEKSEYNDPQKIAEGFNKKYVLKDEAFNDNRSMSQGDIQNFLNNYHKIKDKPHISKIKFDNQRASYWIKKAIDTHSINPRLLLTKLQAEQRLINGEQAVNPNQTQLDGAMGVGMFDDGTMIKELQGFINQISYAAKYFRQFYNEAEQVNFTHENVDGKKLKTFNAATYSLYKYTPHIAGVELVYKVYKYFFGTDDLGGIVQNNSGKIKLKTMLITLFILVSVFSIVWLVNIKNIPTYIWNNKILVGDGLELITELQIFKEKQATLEDGFYCGFRFGKIYNSSAKLLLSDQGKTIDSIDLTNPELVLPKLSDEYLTYYKPWDIDGDGNKQEFVVQEYASCNGNLLSFVRVNKELKKIEKIPISYKNNTNGFSLYVDVGKNAFNVHGDLLEVKYYNNTQGEWLKNWYRYNVTEEILKWLEEQMSTDS